MSKSTLIRPFVPRLPARLAGVLALAIACSAGAEPPVEKTGPAPPHDSTSAVKDEEADSKNIRVHRLTSSNQAGETQVRVLLPSTHEAGKKYPVVYLLPVEAGTESRFGDGLEVARRMNAADRFGVICAAPTFSQLPWYADHPTDPAIRQESYLLHDVLPLVERAHPALAEPRGRLLLGFSKSGWGAWSLALRHPGVFDAAASWDAPLTMDAPGKYGSGPIFGTPENFALYQITRRLDQRFAENRPADLKRPRLVLLGYGGFMDHRAIHEQLERLGAPHAYRDGPKRPHVWSADWMTEALELLLK